MRRHQLLFASVFASLLSATTAFAAPPPLVLAVGGEPATGFDPIMGLGAVWQSAVSGNVAASGC